jgi:ABC-type transport system substrate-binding protein
MASYGDDRLRLIERPLSRRALLGGTLRAGGALALLGGGALLAACGGEDEAASEGATTAAPAPPAETAAPPAATTEAPATTAAPSGPVRGGTLTYAVSSPPSGFDPAKWWNGLSWDGTLVVFNRLLTLKDDGSLEPELLAQAPEVNPEGTLYTFTLRSGVQFHHGRELTADDVKYTLERLVAPATASEGGGLYTGLTIPGMEDILNESGNELTGISVVDPLTFTIELEQPDSVMLYLLGLPFASIVPRDVIEEAGDGFNFAPVGTGPFTMTDVDPDAGLVLERFANYWNPDVPLLDRVEWTIGVDPELSLLRIQDGEQDMMSEPIPSASFPALQDAPDLTAQLFEGPFNNVNYITLSLDHEAMADLRVRQAIAHAVDKERFVRSIKGLGEVATGGLFSPLSPYFQDGLAYPFDPERAKALLAEAGYADGFDVTFWSGDFTPYKEMAETVTQDLEAIGIRMDTKILIREQWLAEIVKNPPGITNNEWELPYPHGSYVMDGAFTQAAIDAGCCNFSNYVSPDFDALVAQAHASTDPAEQVELYKQMDKIAIQDEALWVPLIYPKIAFLVSERAQGFSITAAPTASTHFFDRYWLQEA